MSGPYRNERGILTHPIGCNCQMCALFADVVIPFAREVRQLTEFEKHAECVRLGEWDEQAKRCAEIKQYQQQPRLTNREVPRLTRKYLEAALERALVDMMHATDSRGLMICLSGGTETSTLGQLLRELVDMTYFREFISDVADVTAERIRANHAHNCLLVAKAYDAAAQLEALIGTPTRESRGECSVERGIVFGHARYND
jgi:hypothetical protein